MKHAESQGQPQEPSCSAGPGAAPTGSAGLGQGPRGVPPGTALLLRALHPRQEQTAALVQPQPEPGGRDPTGISDAALFHAGQSRAPSRH